MDRISKIEWRKIRDHFNRSFRSSLHVSIGSVTTEGMPNVTPIGTFFLNSNQSGFYFEKFASSIPMHANDYPYVCVLGVRSKKYFWLKALYRNKFKEYPAIKLFGRLGEKRKATSIEISRLNKRMKSTRGLRGNKYLWSDMTWVRDIVFDRYEGSNLGKMTAEIESKTSLKTES